jgi:hypothetical protein
MTWLLASVMLMPPIGAARADLQGRTGRERVRGPATPLGDPGRFLRGVVVDVAHNDYARAWLGLYPPHQSVAPLAEYVACELRSPIPGRLDAVVVLRSVRASFPVAGRTTPIRGAAVTFRIRLSEPSLSTSVRLRATFHAVLVSGRWTWILPADRYAMYRDDAC